MAGYDALLFLGITSFGAWAWPLYNSTGRSADAHALLGPALEGFAPTPELPEIDEAQALLGTLP